MGYVISEITSNGISVPLDYYVATSSGDVMIAAYFDRAKSKVKAVACSFGGSRQISFGYRHFLTKGYEYTTVYKPVRLGRDRFIYATSINQAVGRELMLTTREFLNQDFYEFLMNNFHLPLLKEWIPYLIEEGRSHSYISSPSLFRSVTDADRSISMHEKQIPVKDVYVLDCRNLDEAKLRKLVSEGLKRKKIIISKNEQKPLKFRNFDEYIQNYGTAIVQKLEKELNPLMELNGKVDSAVFKHKRFYPQQAACVNGIKALKKAGSRYAFGAEGMGCGKTLQGAAVSDSYFNDKWLEDHPGKTLKDLYENDTVKYRNIMMAPSHLVEKWKDELLSEVPNVKVTVLNDFSQLVALRHQGKERTGREWFLISKDFCKLGSQYSPIPTDVGCGYPKLAYCRDCYEERGLYIPMLGTGKKCRCSECGGKKKILLEECELGKLRGMICPKCGNILLKYSPKLYNPESILEPQDYALQPRDFATRKADNSACMLCGTPLWGVDVKPKDCGGEYSHMVVNHKPAWHKVSHYKNCAKKSTVTAWVLRGREQDYYEDNYHAGLKEVEREYGPRKSAPSLFIKKYLKGYFDFCILDECHKYENGGTAQTNAAHALISVSDFTIGLTGTLVNGKADSLFYLLYLLDPAKMKKEGYAYTDVMKFAEIYGAVETAYEAEEGSYNSCSRGKQISSPRVVPGISPVLVSDFLLEKSVFLDLSDLSKYLPALKEKVVLASADDEMKAAYDSVLDAMKQQSAQGEGKGNLGAMITFGLSYLDKPFDRKNIMSTTKENVVAYRVPNLEEYREKLLPKEKILVETVQAELAENRNCFIYACYTGEPESNVSYRLQKVIEDHCNLKGQVYVLTATNPSPAKRERFLKQKAQEGYRVIICNPKCVETGLDFCFWFGGKWYNFPTLIFYQISYELSVIWQASRRAYRLIQTEECRNYYLGYENTLQAAALEVMAEKQVAASAVQGKFSVEGLSALAKGVDPRIKLAKMLSDGDNSSRKSLENMFDALNKNVSNDDAYGDYVPPKTYYELMGITEVKETGEDTLFDLMEDIFNTTVTEESKETVKEKETETAYEQNSLFDIFEDMFRMDPVLSASAVKKPKKRTKKRLDNQISLFDLAV